MDYIYTTKGHYSINMDLFRASPQYIKDVAKGDMVSGRLVFTDYEKPQRVGQKGVVSLTVWQTSWWMAMVAYWAYLLSSWPSGIHRVGNTLMMTYKVTVESVPTRLFGGST